MPRMHERPQKVSRRLQSGKRGVDELGWLYICICIYMYVGWLYIYICSDRRLAAARV